MTAGGLVSALLFYEAGAGRLAVATSPRVIFDINTTEGRLPISPLIYGMNLDATVSPAQFAEVMAETRPGMVRMGGDRWTA